MIRSCLSSSLRCGARRLLLLLLLGSLPLLSACSSLVTNGITTGVMASMDRRSLGAQLDDGTTELKIAARLYEQMPASEVQVNATCYNRTLLLTGYVPDETTRAAVEKLARTMPNIRDTFNELMIGPSLSFPSRAQDSYLTAKVRLRLLNAAQVSPLHVRVVTANGVVYLMGLVTREEAEQAVNTARMTDGVTKVVTGFFEYLN